MYSQEVYMPRLSAAAKAGRTKTATTAAKKAAVTKPRWTRADRIKLIAQDKIDILDHPAKEKVWIGGKGAGKSRPVIVNGNTALEEDPYAQLLALKKYKDGAVTRLHTAVQNVALEMKMLGYDVPEYEKSVNLTYRVVNFKTKSNNQTIEYGSFDDANGLAGIEAKNVGYFAQVHIEEPVEINDPNGVPSAEQWRAAMKTIQDSVNRSNSRHIRIHKRKIPSVTYHYTMNPWDLHPLIVDAEKVFPEQEFIDFFSSDIINNHTLSKYDKKTDTLYIRLTKFGNPVTRCIENMLKDLNISTFEEWEAFDKTTIDWEAPIFMDLGIDEYLVEVHFKDNQNESIWVQANRAIATKDSLSLAQIMGLKYSGSTGAKNTYNLDNLQTTDTDELLKDKDVTVLGMSVGWDVDVRDGRSLVATPVYYIAKKASVFDYDYGVVFGKQRMIAAFGDGIQQQEYYMDRITSVNDEIINKTIELTGKNHFKWGPYVYLDENKINFLLGISKRNTRFKAVGKAKKHGDWEIVNRQDNFQMGISNGFYIIDDKNIVLIKQLKQSIIQEGSVKRDESGKLEKEYDNINSAEYALYPFRMFVHNIKLNPIKLH